MDRSESIKQLSASLVAAQADLGNVVSDAANPHFRNKYASLPHLLDHVRETLANHAIAVVQLPCSGDGGVGIETMLLHDSGEYISSRFEVPLQKNDPQGAGSAITYCRRYSLAAALGIGQEDDDGALGATPPKPKKAPPKDKAAKPVTEAQIKRLWVMAANRADAIGSSREEIVRAVLGKHGMESTKEIAVPQYEAVCAEVEGFGEPGQADQKF